MVNPIKEEPKIPKNIIYTAGVLVCMVLVGIVYLSLTKQDYSKSSTPLSPITNILQSHKENSDKISKSTANINPDNYATVRDFVNALEFGTGELDITKNDFVAVVPKGGSWAETYIRFEQNTLTKSPLFATEDAKNEAISDIFQAYKTGKIYATSTYTGSVAKVLFGDETGFPGTKDFNEILATKKNIYSTITDLEKNAKDKYDREYLSFLYSFTGDYAKAANIRDELCSKNSCSAALPILFTGSVNDDSGKPMAGANIYLMSDPKISTTTDENGKFKISGTVAPFSALRFKATKTGYSDGFYSIVVNQAVFGWVYPIVHDFHLIPANGTAELNAGNLQNGYWEFSSTQSKYRLAKDALVYIDGKPYTQSDVKVYLYEFNKNTNMDDFMKIDTFSPVYGYVGNIMKTFGMPYIQFFDKNGKELFVRSSKSMLLHNNIYHMKELYENHDKIYTAITNDDMKQLVKVSKEKGWFPIDFDWLTKNAFLRWPAWWVLDRKTGVWKNVGSRVVDESGVVELPFYSVYDGAVSIE